MISVSNRTSNIYKSKKLYLLAVILLGVFAFNTYQIENHFALSFISLLFGCSYTGIYFFSSLEDSVKEKKFFLIFIKGLIFYLALFKLIASLAFIFS